MALGTAAVALTLTACSTTDSTADKAGGNSEPITLRLGTPEGPDAPYVDDLEHFAERVAELSGGTVDVEVVVDAVPPFDPTAEQRLADAVMAGDFDLAMVAARAWELVDVDTFRALQVPFLVDSDELLADVVQSDLADRMLAGLDGSAVTPLTMIPESLRHPIGYDTTFVSAADFDGAKFRWNISPATADLAPALGIEVVIPEDAGEAITTGELDGLETAFVWAHTMPIWGGTITGNLSLYAKAQTLVANSERFDDLPDEVQGHLREAAADTLAYSVETSTPDHELAATYCAEGGRVGLASAAQLDELRQVVEPYVATLTADPFTAEMVAGIRALHEQRGSDTTGVASCEPATEDVESAAVDEFPAGVYRQDSRYGIVTHEIRDGEWKSFLADGSLDCVHTYEVRGGRVYLTASVDSEYSCGSPTSQQFLDAAFALEGGQLLLTDINSNPDAVIDFGVPSTLISSWVTDETDEFPEGRYRMDQGPVEGVVTVEFGDGVWRRYLEDGTLDCMANYVVRDGRMFLTWTDDRALSCGTGLTNVPFFDAEFSLTGDQLLFTEFSSPQLPGFEFTRPWTQIESWPTDDGDEFPEGLYRAENAIDGIVMMRYEDGVWTRYVADGTLDCVAEYEVRDGRIYLTWTVQLNPDCVVVPGEKFVDAAFAMEGDQLRITDINPNNPLTLAEFDLPWTLIEEPG